MRVCLCLCLERKKKKLEHVCIYGSMLKCCFSRVHLNVYNVQCTGVHTLAHCVPIEFIQEKPFSRFVVVVAAVVVVVLDIIANVESNTA